MLIIMIMKVIAEALPTTAAIMATTASMFVTTT